MALQEPRPRECLAADLTFTGQRVRTDVHFQCTERIVGFVAEFTLKLFLDLSNAVKLFVLGETTERGVGL